MNMTRPVQCGVRLFCSALLFSGCSFQRVESLQTADSVSEGNRFLSSGTVIISHQVPERSQVPSPYLAGGEETKPQLMAPLIGYFPPSVAYLPADNETWLEIDRQLKKLVVYRGNASIKEIQAEGAIDLQPGEYYLQHKQKQPLWYATDDYFTRRKLRTPAAGTRLRYRRGALGRFALYPTTTFPIHCGPVWTEDVGGLKVSLSDLSSIYYMLPLGTPIVVK